MNSVERLPYDIESAADFAELRRQFTRLPMKPKIMASRADGVDISSPGRQSLTLLIGEETAGAMYAGDVYLMPGFGAPPHHQPTEEELWYLVEGELDVRVGTQPARISAGAFAYIPRNTTHTFKSSGTGPARLLTWDSPAGHERAFEGMKRKAAQGITDFPSLRGMFAAHGVNMHADPAELAPADPLTGTRAAPLEAAVRDASDFARYREALRALPRLPSLVAGRDEAPSLSWPGTDLRLLLASEQSAGEFNAADIVFAPGEGIPAHRREATDQCVYLLGGEFEVGVDGTTRTLARGAFVFVPRGSTLRLRNRGDGPGQLLLWNTPAGMEPVYRLLHERGGWRGLGADDRARLAACDFTLV